MPLTSPCEALMPELHASIVAGLSLSDAIRRVIKTAARSKVAVTFDAVMKYYHRSRWSAPLAVKLSTRVRHSALTPARETVLIEFLIAMGRLGAPLPPIEITGVVNDTWDVGVAPNFGFRFVERHYEKLKLVQPKATANRRKSVRILETVTAWVEFINNDEYVAANRHRVWNVDELRLTPKESRCFKAVFARGDDVNSLQVDKSNADACMVPFVNAGGVCDCVFFVLKKNIKAGKEGDLNHGTRVPIFEYAFDAKPGRDVRSLPDIYYLFNETGNVNKSTWRSIARCFGERRAARSPGLRHYLWLDNLGPHLDTSANLSLMEFKVTGMFLPRNSTHLFQPLDQAPYGLYKRGLASEKRKAFIGSVLVGKPEYASTDGIVEIAIRLLRVCMTEANIAGSFLSTGLWPWNGELIMEKARKNAAQYDVPTVSDEAQKLFNQYVSSITPQSKRREVMAEVEKDMVYTTEHLLVLAKKKKLAFEERVEKNVLEKRKRAIEIFDNLPPAKRAAYGGVNGDGLPVDGSAYWRDHCSICASLKRANAKEVSECENCDTFYLCFACSEVEQYQDELEEHSRGCGGQ